MCFSQLMAIKLLPVKILRCFKDLGVVVGIMFKLIKLCYEGKDALLLTIQKFSTNLNHNLNNIILCKVVQF